MEGHKPVYIVLILLAVSSYIVTVIFNFFAAGPGVGLGIFHNRTGDLAAKYYVEITPAGWAFSIWGIIYIWQGLWLIYSVSTIFRFTSYGYLYVNPLVLPPTLYVCFVINMGLNLVWIFLWDREFIIMALVALVVLWATIAFCFAVSLRGLYNYGTVYIREEVVKDVWLVRLLVQNGLGLYFGWTAIAATLNLAVVLTYSAAGVHQSISSTASLSILFLWIMTWFFVDVFAFDKYSRYVVTPYLVNIFALVGMFTHIWDPQKNNPVLVVAILATSVLLMVVKLILLVYRHFKYPVWSRANIPASFFESKNSYGATDYITL